MENKFNIGLKKEAKMLWLWILFGVAVFLLVLASAYALCKSAALADKAFRDSIKKQHDALNTTITSGSPVSKD
jgi:putative exporter of polyketide antibiotics